MKICLAQTKPISGQVESNQIAQEKFIKLAHQNGADLIIFPELSLTGYEPRLAQDLSMDQQSKNFEKFQLLADKLAIIIISSAPLKTSNGPSISSIIFQPFKQMEIYSKRFLHADELPYFISGEKPVYINTGDQKISIAICYEISVPEHAEEASKNKATIYLASVAKTKKGMELAYQGLPQIAKKYSMQVLICNSIGFQDNFEAAGLSAVWNQNAELITSLDNQNEGIILYDTETQSAVAEKIDLSFSV